jgi:hypothetical protein
MTSPIPSPSQVHGASPILTIGPIMPLPHAVQRLTHALTTGSLEEARSAAAMLKQTFEAFRQDPDSWRAVAPETLVENTVDLLITVVTHLHREEFYDWLTGSLQPQLARWVDRLEEGLSISLGAIPEGRRADSLMRIAARGRQAVDTVLETAANGQANASVLAYPASMGVVITSLRGLQEVLKALRIQIKAETGQQVEGGTDAARNFRKLSVLLTVAFISLMLVRISAVVLGGVLLAQPPSEEGINGLSVGRFALNSANLATTFVYERIRERRTDALAKRTMLSQERAELKKALFRAQDWTTALQTLQSMGEESLGRRALCPANLTAGFTALERIQNGQQQESPVDAVALLPRSVGGQSQANQDVLLSSLPVDLAAHELGSLRPEMFEQQAKVLSEAMERLMDPMRDVIQSCAWVCEGIPTGTESTPAAMGAVATILERHLSMLTEHQKMGAALSREGQRLLRSALENQRSCCGSNRPRTVQVLMQLLDYGFAASACLSGGVEAFAGLDEAQSKQILFATAIIDALNSGTAPLRELFFNRAESYQRVVLQLSQAVAAVEGILPLADSAGRAFCHIGEALRATAHSEIHEQTSEDLMDRAREGARVAREIGHLAILLIQCPPDSTREPLEQRIQEMVRLLEELSLEPSPMLQAREVAPSPAHTTLESAVDSTETTSLNHALAEAVLLPEERGGGAGERPMPNLVAQLRRATQRAEQGIQAAQGPRLRQSISGHSPTALTISGGTRPGTGPVDPELLLHAEVSIDMRPRAVPTASSSVGASAASGSDRIPAARPAQLWNLVRRSYRLLAAQGYLERGGWRDPIPPGKEGLRLASLLRAALIVSSARVLNRYQAMASTVPAALALSAPRASPTAPRLQPRTEGVEAVVQLGEPTTWV